MKTCYGVRGHALAENSENSNLGWQAYITPEYVVKFSRCFCNFALMSMSLSELQYLYDIMGGSLKIWFRNGCCCIEYHFLVRVSLRFGTAGWYGITKDKIRVFVLFCWRRACAFQFLQILLSRVCC